MRKYWDNSGPGAGGSPGATQPVPSSLTIGKVRIAPATVLAPMAGVTDTVFRRFIRNLGGCGLIMTEFTSADGILRSNSTCISMRTNIRSQRSFLAAIPR